ncbi:hypothetical protein FBU59_006427 [Linderina macrospora]|uniref:Uncharacterized protein n=1 Tax=Linderina macrospora TaxID=4868 RepID=A0ACC1IZY8_9FUNG|nr:hypothetical protein FBU59_006427 [Linderina macrospora]
MASKGIVVVTGASRGMGKAISEYLVAHSATVIGVARSAAALAALADSLGPLFVPCALDITDDTKLPLVLDTINRLPTQPLLALVNNAGVLGPLEKLATASVSDWRHNFDVNVFSILALTQLCLPKLRESRGRIINVSSGAAVNAYSGWAAYCAAKAAVNMLTASMAVEEPEVVAVALRPGVVDTEMQAEIRSDGAGAMGDIHGKFLGYHANGELLPPDVPGNVVARLALGAGKELSGKFYSWNAPELAAFRD